MSAREWVVFERRDQAPRGKVMHTSCATDRGLVDAEGFPAKGWATAPVYGEERPCDACGAPIDGPRKLYSDDFQRCACGSTTFGRFETYAYPPTFDGANVRLADSYRCAHCKRLGTRTPSTDASTERA